MDTGSSFWISAKQMVRRTKCTREGGREGGNEKERERERESERERQREREEGEGMARWK